VKFVRQCTVAAGVSLLGPAILFTMFATKAIRRVVGRRFVQVERQFRSELAKWR
jgi:hypothetical protein